MTPRGVLARRVAATALTILSLQLAAEFALQYWFSSVLRGALMVEVVTFLDETGGLAGCEDRPGPWVGRDRIWNLWPVAADGRVIGLSPPIDHVEPPPPGQIAERAVGGYRAVLYGSKSPSQGCAAILVIRDTEFPILRWVRTELFAVGALRISVLLVAAVAMVAATAWPLVRRIRSLAHRMSAVVDAGFEGGVHDGATDEVGDLAHAFDAAAGTARARLERLEHRDRVLRVALADLTHDLRTPLATLKLSASGLSASPTTSAIRAELAYMEGLTQNFEALLDGDGTDAREAVALDGVVERLCHRFGRLAADRHLEFEVALPDVSPQVHADGLALERAIGNLIQNALRWASAHVVVVLWTEGDEARVEVRDDGPGLGDMATDAVRRGVRGPDARGEGFGLGLAIAEATARRFGGRLELRDGPEGGTYAGIVLPLLSR